MEIEQLEKVASQVRRDIVRMVHGCQSGHPGGSLGCTELLVALYFERMKLKEHDGKVVFSSFRTVTFPRFGTACWPAKDISLYRSWLLSAS
jgi:hypothetical protein